MVADLGRYTLLERVGEGGMAEVFRARLDGPMGFQKEIAIKRIRDSVVNSDDEFVQSLINEARIGGRLHHQNIVQVHELGKDDGVYFIAMEFVDGVSLSELLADAREQGYTLPHNVSLDVAIQVARGLAFAHRQVGEDGRPLELVHRDLKPSNIMISLGGTAKLMDFGIAKASNNLFNTTNTGIAKGTPLYMSPEQLRGMRPLPSCSDIFSFGAILYELATGRILFAGKTIPQIITRVLNTDLGEAVAAAEQAIPGLGAILARCLERDVAGRIQSADAIAVELAHLMEWQKQEVSTAKFVQAFHKDLHNGGLMDVRPHPVGAVPIDGRRGTPEEILGSALISVVGTRFLDVQRQRRRLLGFLLFVLFLTATAGVITLIYKGTVGVFQGFEAARMDLARGNPAGAEAQWRSILSDHEDNEEARYGVMAAHAWTGLLPDEAEWELLYSPLRENTDAEFVRKHLSLAWAARRAGDDHTAFRILKIALDRTRGEAGVYEAAPHALLWEAGEVALLRESPDAAKVYFRLLASAMPAGIHSDAAAAYVEEVKRGNGPLLTAELLFIDGRLDTAYERLPARLQAMVGSRDRRRGERIVWAYRALADGRYEMAAKLVQDLGPLGGERELRRRRSTVQAAAAAAKNDLDGAKRAIKSALKTANTDEASATSRLQVAYALLRQDPGTEAGLAWADNLIAEAEELLGERDPDIRFLIELRDGAPALEDAYAAAVRLSADPRSGRFYPAGLRRGGPGASKLIPPQGYGPVNLSTGGRKNRLAGFEWTPSGSAAPFGPTFHPLDHTPLPYFFHPGR